MSIPPTLKAFGDTYVRLFDHRPIVSSEINFLLHEFETKRNDREKHNSEKMLVQCQDSDRAIDEATLTMQRDFSTLLQSLDRCTKACNVIAAQEKDQNAEPILTEKARERSERWQKFLAEQRERAQSVDNRFEEEKLKLEITYEELERKLCSST